jgi:lysozyme family protein
MTAENFDRSLALVLKSEGGYSNNPADPGGATQWGITHIDYDAYRKRRGLKPQDVRRMTPQERDDIYRTKYWDGAKCDDLPSGVDYCVFDGAVNSGVAQSVKWLQRAIGGIVVDGHAGDVTIESAKDADPEELVNSVCDQRMIFLRSLRTFKTFGKGWTSRVTSVRANALSMTDHVEAHADTEFSSSAKAKIVDQAPPVVDQATAVSATAGTGVAASVMQQIQTQLAPYSDTLTAIKYALIAVSVIGLAITIYTIVRANKIKAVS